VFIWKTSAWIICHLTRGQWKSKCVLRVLATILRSVFTWVCDVIAESELIFPDSVLPKPNKRIVEQRFYSDAENTPQMFSMHIKRIVIAGLAVFVFSRGVGILPHPYRMRRISGLI
jgi:hypothetical protein